MAPQTPAEKEAHLKRVNAELADANTSQERKNDLLIIQKSLEDDLDQSAAERAEKLADEVTKLERRNELFDEGAKIRQKELELHQANIAAAEEEIDKLLTLKTEQGALNEEQAQYLEDLLVIRQGESELLKQLSASQEKYNEELAKAPEFAKKLGGMLGLSAKYSESLLGSITSQLDAITNNADAQQEFLKQMKETFSVSNLMSSVFSKVLESTVAIAMAFDTATTSFNAATGAAGKYNQVIEDVGSANRALGIGMEEASAAAGSLHTNFSDFTNLSDEAAKSLTTTTAALGKLGIDGATAAKNLQFMTKTMGMSATAANDLAVEMAEWDIGISPAQLGADFAAAAPKLAQFGSEAIKVFKGLEKQSKATGAALGSLISIADGLDTFESAAMAAGKLNALLGGPFLNSVALVNASLEEKIEMLQQAVIESGHSWEAMSRQEQKAIAAAAGISDMTVAAGLFGENQTEVTESQKKLSEMIEKSIPIMEKLKGIAASFAVLLGPIINDLSEWASGAQEWVDENKPLVQLLGKMVLGVGALVIVYKSLKAIMALVRVGMILSAAATTAASAANTALGTSSTIGVVAIKTMGKAMQQAAPGFLAFGVAALFVGAGVALAAFGLSLFVKAFAGLNAEQIDGATLALILFGAAIVGFVLVMALLIKLGLLPAVALGLIGIGLAAMMIGVGMMLAAVAAKIMVSALTGLFSLFAENETLLPKVSLGILSLAYAMGMLILMSYGFPILVGAFYVLAAGVLLLASSLALIKTDDIEALATLGKSLSEMSIGKSIAFTASMVGLSDVMKEAQKAGIVTVSMLSSMVKSVAVGTPAKEAAIAPSPFKQHKMKEAQGSRTPQTITVNFEIGGEKFASKVVKIVDERLNLAKA